MSKTYITKEGYQKLTNELSALRDKSNHLIVQIEEVAQPDESGEDGLATQLKEELEVINEKITSIEDVLEMSEIISGKTGKKDLVEIGCQVKIKISDNSTKCFNIVSHIEADPSQNKISDQSPLGQALMGKKINELIEVQAPIGKVTYKIIAIS